MSSESKIRVLVIDDSGLMRKVLSRVLSRDPLIEVVGTAADAYEGRDKILELNPAVVTLDIEMPRMDGISFLKILMRHHPLPVVIVSAMTQTGSAKAYEALEAGAIEVLGKPLNSCSAEEFEVQLTQKVKSAAIARFRKTRSAAVAEGVEPGRSLSDDERVIVLGASTGGVEALKDVLSQLPDDLPPICIVQHIPAYISARFATRLNDVCAMDVREAREGDVLERGLALVAPGGYHMALQRSAKQYRIELLQTPAVNYQRPSVDVLFSSAAQCAGPRAIGALLTGMGKDGAEGLLRLRESGAFTIAQNEETCVVYGMPRVAIEIGAARHVLPLERIASGILRCLERSG